jgi:hypothetical protein
MTATPPDPDNVRALHSALVAKRATLDQLIWQAPVIALTAQAFLMTIAFDTDKSAFYRCLSGTVATIIGLLSWQLFLRHTFIERQATMQLEELELRHFGQTVHARPAAKLHRVSGWRSRPIWACCLFLVSLAGLLPLLEVIIGFHP